MAVRAAGLVDQLTFIALHEMGYSKYLDHMAGLEVLVESLLEKYKHSTAAQEVELIKLEQKESSMDKAHELL